MKDTLINLETAKLAIKVGFEKFFPKEGDMTHIEGSKYTILPTQSLLYKILMDFYNIHIEIGYYGIHLDKHHAYRGVVKYLEGNNGLISTDIKNPITSEGFIFRSFSEVMEIGLYDALKSIEIANRNIEFIELKLDGLYFHLKDISQGLVDGYIKDSKFKELYESCSTQIRYFELLKQQYQHDTESAIHQQ